MTSLATGEEQRAFFERHRAGIARAAERGAAAVLELIAGFAGVERRVLHLYARRALAMDEWQGKDLDVILAVARAGIDELVSDARETSDEAARTELIATANVISLNLANDLADCWPGDDLPRTRAHHEAGLRAAEDAIRWRQELGKPASSHGLAWWAKGAHQLALGDARGAAASFDRSNGFARDAADPDDFSVVLGDGYLALARWAAGDPDGRGAYEAALGVFEKQLENGDRAQDARFGIDQLETMRARRGVG